MSFLLSSIFIFYAEENDLFILTPSRTINDKTVSWKEIGIRKSHTHLHPEVLSRSYLPISCTKRTFRPHRPWHCAPSIFPCLNNVTQLDWTPSRNTREINLPTNQKGYDNSKTSVGKLSARRIQICLVYLCKIYFRPLFQNNFPNIAQTKIYQADSDLSRPIL